MGNMKKINKGIGAVAAAALIVGGTSQVASAATNKGNLSKLEATMVQKKLIGTTSGVLTTIQEKTSVKIKTLKAENDEPSMSGTYLEKEATYIKENGKIYCEIKLLASDWMKNIKIEVEGKETKHELKETGVTKVMGMEHTGATIKFEVPKVNPQITFHMYVVPMSNDVTFRVVGEGNGSVTGKPEQKPDVKPDTQPTKPDTKPEVKDEQAVNTVPVLKVGQSIETEAGKAIDLMKDVTAEDKEDGDLTKNIKVEAGKLDAQNPTEGTYEVTYSVTDSKGEIVTKTRKVVVTKDKEKTDGKWINVKTLPKVETTAFGEFYGDYNKYRISFPGTKTDEEFEKFEKYIKAVNDTNKITVNGIMYSNEGLVNEKDNYHFGALGFDFNPSEFTEDINTVVIKANGYNDMKVVIKKDGTFVSQEEIKSQHVDTTKPEQENKVKLPKVEKVEFGKFYGNCDKYRISFLSKTDDEWNCLKEYTAVVNKTNKVIVNETNYSSGDEEKEKNYNFGMMGLELNPSAFKDGINTIVIKADGYEDVTIKIKKDGQKVSLEKSTSENGNTSKPEKPNDTGNAEKPTDGWRQVTTLPKITNARYGEIYGRVEYEISLEQNDELQKYINASSSYNDKAKPAEVTVNGVKYDEAYNFSINQYHLSYIGGLELNDKAFTEDINTIIVKVDGYNDMRIKIKKDGTLVSQEEATTGTAIKENIQINIMKDIDITAGESIDLRSGVLAHAIGKEKIDLTDNIKVDAGKLDVKNPKAGTYEVTYSVTYNGQTETKKRKVIVTQGDVTTDKLTDGVYTIGFKAYRYDIPENESMLGGFFDEKVKVEVKDGKINLTMLNTLYAHSLLDFRIESNGKYISAKGTYKGEANSQGEYAMQTYEVPISDLTSEHVGCVLVGMMGGRKSDIGNYDKYKKVRLVFDKTCIKGWDGFNKDKEVVDTDGEFNKTLIEAGLDKDGDGTVTDEEIAKAKGVVNLKGKKIKDISRLRHLGKEVTELHLSANNIKQLPKGVFDGLTGLEKLYLNAIGIVELPEGIFDNLTNLTELSLDQNYITKLPKGIFDKLKNLKSLGFTENQLSELPDHIFDNLTALEGLYLYNNKIENIPTGIGKLKKLKTLAMNENKIEIVPEELSELSSLTSLSLNNNLIKEIPEKVYKNLKNLSTFNIYDNELTSIPDNIKELLPNVRNFDFKLNRLEKNPNISNLAEDRFYPQKNSLNLQLTAKDGKLTWKQELSALDLYVWKTYMDNCSSTDEYNKKLNGKTSEEYLSEKSKDWRIITEIQKKDSSGKYVTIEDISKENEKDVIEGTYNDADMKAGNEYRIIKSVISTGGFESRIFSDIATTVSENSGNTKPEEKPTENQGKVEETKLPIKALKSENNEPSMAGTYLGKEAKYIKENGKLYCEIELLATDWMKNIKVEVEGKEVKHTIKGTGTTKVMGMDHNGGIIRFEVPKVNPKLTFHTYVVPMSSDVIFRVVGEESGDISTKPTKPGQKPDVKPEQKPEQKPETKPEQKPDTKPESKPEVTKQIRVVALKENSNEPSMAGEYLNKSIKYTEKDGKKYFTVTLTRMDWMKNVEVSVDGRSVSYDKKESGSNADLTFEVGSKNSQVTLRMNVVPMGNARVAFRVVNENSVKPEQKPEQKPQQKPETKPEKTKPVIDITKSGEYKVKNEIEVKVKDSEDKEVAKQIVRKYLSDDTQIQVENNKTYIVLNLSKKINNNLKVMVNGKKVEYKVLPQKLANQNIMLASTDDIRSLIVNNQMFANTVEEGSIVKFEVPDLNSNVEIEIHDEESKKDIQFALKLNKDTIKTADEEQTGETKPEVKPDQKPDTQPTKPDTKPDTKPQQKPDKVETSTKTNYKDGLYDVNIKVLKENSNEPSMAGTYLGDKVKIQIKNGKKYAIATLNRSDWMKNIDVLVNGKSEKYDVVNVKSSNNGEKSTTIKFELPDLDSEIKFKMNVEPMGNARVTFRVLLQKDSLKFLKGNEYDPNKAEEYLNNLADKTQNNKKDVNVSKTNENTNSQEIKEKKLPKTGLPFGGGILATIGTALSGLGITLMKRNKKRGN